MNDHHDSTAIVIGKVVTLTLVWLGGVKLADIQVFVAIVSGLCVAAYAALQFVALWRREFKRKQP